MIILNADVKVKGQLNIDYLLKLVDFDHARSTISNDTLNLGFSESNGVAAFRIAGDSAPTEFDATELMAYLLGQVGCEPAYGQLSLMLAVQSELEEFHAGGVDVDYFKGHPQMLAITLLTTNESIKGADLYKLLEHVLMALILRGKGDSIYHIIAAFGTSKIKFYSSLSRDVDSEGGLCSLGLYDSIHNGVQSRGEKVKAAMVLGVNNIMDKFDGDKPSTGILRNITCRLGDDLHKDKA